LVTDLFLFLKKFEQSLSFRFTSDSKLTKKKKEREKGIDFVVRAASIPRTRTARTFERSHPPFSKQSAT
jgi:hypothetical protein